MVQVLLGLMGGDDVGRALVGCGAGSLDQAGCALGGDLGFVAGDHAAVVDGQQDAQDGRQRHDGSDDARRLGQPLWHPCAEREGGEDANHVVACSDGALKSSAGPSA